MSTINKKEMLDLRIKMLLRNGIVSKSGMTLASTEVLKEIAKRLGYSLPKLKSLDVSDPTVNVFARLRR